MTHISEMYLWCHLESFHSITLKVKVGAFQWTAFSMFRAAMNAKPTTRLNMAVIP